MADLPNNVQFTWQLVSQFVSWEFCKYMSENKENNNSETDVLGYLRDMIVQRTEKSVSDVTKHEIIAKFIMEIKAINNFQVSSIFSLSESVKRICPELNAAVDKLVHHLETFFDIFRESTGESTRTAIVQARIEDAISDFSKEASRLLPEPDLLQVVDSWSGIHHHHNHPHPEPPKKSAYNAALFEEVLKCLHFEGMTPSEARLIAVALNEDKVFENILRNAEAEPEVNSHFTQVLENFHYTKVYENILRNVLAGPETEADSELTHSQSSQPVYSQEFIKNTQATKTKLNPFNHQSPPNLQAHTQVPVVDDNSLQLSDGSSVPPNGLDLPQNEDPPNVLARTPPSPPPSPTNYPFTHREISDQTKNAQLQKSTYHTQFAQSSSNESDEGDGDLQDRIQAKFQQIHDDEMGQNQSDVDTSDCDLNADIRFLTPTYFKKGENHVIYVSDVESNDSSVITNVPGSQRAEDPSWSRHQSSLPATQYVRPNKRQKKKNSPVKKKKTNLPVKKRPPPRRRLPSSESEENLVSPAPSKPPYYPSACTVDELRSPHLSSVSADCTIDEHRSPHLISVSPNCTIDDLRSPHLSTSATSTRVELGSPHRPSTSATRTRAELGGPLKKRKMTKALYRSPTLCIDEFISTLRKPNSDTLSEVSVPNVTTARKAKKTALSGLNTLKKQKCKQCNKTYKTTIALRRHVFLKHTDPPEDSDCDT